MMEMGRMKGCDWAAFALFVLTTFCLYFLVLVEFITFIQQVLPPPHIYQQRQSTLPYPPAFAVVVVALVNGVLICKCISHRCGTGHRAHACCGLSSFLTVQNTLDL